MESSSNTPQELSFATGAIIDVKSLGGGKFTVTQVKQYGYTAPAPGKGVKGRLNFEYNIGPVKIKGYLDTTSLEIVIDASVMGISLGTIKGNLVDGVIIKIDLFLASGELRFYLKNGNQLWVDVDVKIQFDGSYKESHMLLKW